MSSADIQLSHKRALEESRLEPLGRALPAWWLVFVRELSELWIWGKALTLIIFYSIYLGVSSYIFAANSELSLLPPREMVYLTISGAITVGLFVALIIGADSFSGERERATLEALLLTPANRTQIVIGKFLASVSPWPIAMVIAVPYIVVLSQGNDILGKALLWGAIMGCLLSPAFTGFGMIVSMWSASNRTSLFASLTLYLLFLLPVQFPGSAQTGTFGRLLKKIDPLEGADHFLEKIIVNNRTVGELMPFLWGTIIFAVMIFAVLFIFAAPRLNLDGGLPIRFTRKPKLNIVSMVLAASLLLALSTTFSARALPAKQIQTDNLQISIDMTSAETKNGDKVEFQTVVKNNAAEKSPALIVAVNIINLSSTGDVVDPEDWSPERTQYLESLAPGSSATQSWVLNTILEGNYMVYVVLIPTPATKDTTSQPVTSSGIHIKVNSFTRLNPGGILPFAIGIPVFLILISAGLGWFRRRGIDSGASL